MTTTALATKEETSSTVNYREDLLNLRIRKQDAQAYIVHFHNAIVSLKYGHHWGPPFPGSDKDTLLQPGAQVLNKLLGVYIRPLKEERLFDFDRGFFLYEHTVEIVNIQTGRVEAVGVGSCNSYEIKYRYRNANRQCPKCKVEAIFQSKYEPGWYCNRKAGGCGANFAMKDPLITSQATGKVLNENPADQLRTYQAMSIKRAHVSATAAHTCCSDIWGADGDRTIEFDSYSDDMLSENAQPSPPSAQDQAKHGTTTESVDLPAGPSASTNFNLVPLRAKLKNLILTAHKKTPDTDRDFIVSKALGKDATWASLDSISSGEELQKAINTMEAQNG